MAISTAVFVDFENLIMTLRNHPERFRLNAAPAEAGVDLLRKLLTHLRGEESAQIIFGRVFAAWEQVQPVSAIAQLALAGLHPSYVLARRERAFTSLELSLEAQDLAYTRDDIRRYVIVSGCRDIIPIARRLIEHGRTVWIVGFDGNTSSDLMDVVGAEHFLDAYDFLEEQVAVDAEPPTEPVQTDDELLAVCLRLLKKAAEDYNNPDVWLSPFYKRYLNSSLRHLSHDQRKALVNELKDRGVIEILAQTAADGSQYAVARIRTDHAFAIEVLGVDEDDTQGLDDVARQPSEEVAVGG